jgi:hypothetical protein
MKPLSRFPDTHEKHCTTLVLTPYSTFSFTSNLDLQPLSDTN